MKLLGLWPPLTERRGSWCVTLGGLRAQNCYLGELTYICRAQNVNIWTGALNIPVNMYVNLGSRGIGSLVCFFGHCLQMNRGAIRQYENTLMCTKLHQHLLMQVAA